MVNKTTEERKSLNESNISSLVSGRIYFQIRGIIEKKTFSYREIMCFKCQNCMRSKIKVKFQSTCNENFLYS